MIQNIRPKTLKNHTNALFIDEIYLRYLWVFFFFLQNESCLKYYISKDHTYFEWFSFNQCLTIHHLPVILIVQLCSNFFMRHIYCRRMNYVLRYTLPYILPYIPFH